MLRIRDIAMGPEQDTTALLFETTKILRVSASEIQSLHLVRRSVDARKKDQIQLVYTVQLDLAEESAILRRQLRQVKPVERLLWSATGRPKNNQKRKSGLWSSALALRVCSPP